MADEQIKHIVRIANTDLNGSKQIGVALTKIRGVKYMFANLMCKLADVDTKKKAGLLDSHEIAKLNDVLANPSKYHIPIWMMNRRKDFSTGEDMHLVTSNLQFATEQDIRRMQKIRSYKGVRHAVGLPVRGQRTKSNFRRNKGKAVGVKRKADVKPAKE